MFNVIPAALILFVLASLFKISFIYNVSYVLFGVYILATLWSQRSLKDLRFRRRYQERALFGDVVEVTLEIENRGWLPIPWLQFHDRLPLALITPPFYRALVSLQPREVCRFSYELYCRQRGWYEVGPLTVQVGDVFGLSHRQQDFSEGAHLTVYPKILPIDELGLPSKSPFGHLRTKQMLYEDPARVVGVRDYQSGDSLRKINWKVSASAGRLQVKKLEPAMTLETVILLNVNSTEYTRQHAYGATEMAIVVAASIANYLAGLRQEVGLLTNGVDPAEAGGAGLTGYLPRKGRAQLTSILELLGRLAIVSDRPFWPLVREEIKRLPWGSTLIAITPRETEELLDSALILQRSGFNVVFVYVDYPSPEVYEVAHQRAMKLGFQAYRVWREEDVDIWRRRVQAAI